MFKNGVDIEAKDQDQKTSLHVAARGGRHEIVGLLLNHNADVNATDKWGQTPLHTAVFGEDSKSVTQIVKLLLNSGADKGAKDKYDQLPYNRITPKNQSPELLELLRPPSCNIL